MIIATNYSNHLKDKYLKKEYSANDIIRKIADMKLAGYKVTFILDCYNQPNTGYIGGYQKPVEFNRPNIWIKNLTSEDIGTIAESVDKYLIEVRICIGPTSSKHVMTVFNKILED